MADFPESADGYAVGLELRPPLQFAVARRGMLTVEPRDEEKPGTEAAYFALFHHLFGELPQSVYDPDFLESVRKAERIVSEQAILAVEATQAQLRADLRARAVGLFLGPPQVDLPSKTKNPTLTRARQAFPFSNAFHPGFFLSPPHRLAAAQATKAFTSGSFSALWEDRLASSTLMPARGINASLPFYSLRDFVLSLLPRTLPIRSYTEDLRIHHETGHADRDALVVGAVQNERERVFEALRICFPELKDLTLAPLSREEAFNWSGRLDGDVFISDWSVAPLDHREIESLHEQMLRVLPEMLPHIKEQAGGTHPMKRLQAVPLVRTDDLEGWARLNQISPEELAALVDYLNGEKPKNLSVLRTLINRLFFTTSSLRRTEEGPTQRGVLFWEEGLRMDPWTLELLAQVSHHKKKPGQSIIYQTQGKRSELELGQMVRGHNDSPWETVDVERFNFLSHQLGDGPNPEESLVAFEKLLEEIFGGVEESIQFLEELKGHFQYGAKLSCEGSLTVLGALLPGYLKATWRVLCEGLGTQGELPETAVRGATIAEKYQDCVAILVGKNGFKDREDHYLCTKWSDANDMAQLVTTEYNYYRNRPDLIVKGLGKYLHSIGALSSKEATNVLSLTPVAVYSLAKRYYLARDYGKTVEFVAKICDLDRMDGYHAEVANKWADEAEAFKQKTGGKLGMLGLEGYARVMQGEGDFVQELLRMGVLSANQLLARGSGSAETLEAQRKDWSAGFALTKRGPLTTSQVVNFHLAQAQFLRDRARFDEADLEIERTWEILEGAPEGYLQRRIEHNEVEILWEKMAKEGGLVEAHLPKLMEMAIKERHLTKEEKEHGNPMRIWEYAATYFQILISIQTLPQHPQLNCPGQIDRRQGEAFEAGDFSLERLEDHLLEASREAIQSARELFKVQPQDARGAVGLITAFVRSLADSPQIQKLPILTEWEALVSELAPKQA
jgi:hypothetical protein